MTVYNRYKLSKKTTRRKKLKRCTSFYPHCSPGLSDLEVKGQFEKIHHISTAMSLSTNIMICDRTPPIVERSSNMYNIQGVQQEAQLSLG